MMNIFWLIIGLSLLVFNTNYIIQILGLYLVIEVLLKHEMIEHLQVSGEAIQNVGSIYNDQKMVIKNLEVTDTFNQLPKGIIVAWQGTDLPKGWALCNGSNGTPDLAGRFVLGVGGNDKIGSIGGARTHTLIPDEMPKHNHMYWVSGPSKKRGYENRTDPVLKTDEENKVKYTAEVGGNLPHNNMPPYYVLAYIMKL